MALPTYVIGVSLHESRTRSRPSCSAPMSTSSTCSRRASIRTPTCFASAGRTSTGCARAARPSCSCSLRRSPTSLLLGGFAALVFTSAWPSNKYGELALTVGATGLWVDFAKDVVVTSRARRRRPRARHVVREHDRRAHRLRGDRCRARAHRGERLRTRVQSRSRPCHRAAFTHGVLTSTCAGARLAARMRANVRRQASCSIECAWRVASSCPSWMVSRGCEAVIAAVILAASASRRRGQPKQLVPWRGTTLIRSIACQVCGSACDEIAIVLGAHADLIVPELAGLPIAPLATPSWATHVSSSLHVATDWARERGAQALVLIGCDQPRLTSKHARPACARPIAWRGARSRRGTPACSACPR